MKAARTRRHEPTEAAPMAMGMRRAVACRRTPWSSTFFQKMPDIAVRAERERLGSACFLPLKGLAINQGGQR